MFNIKNTRLAFELVTFSHTVFILPLIISGYLFISREVNYIDIFLICIATMGARNIGFIFNRIIDADIDRINPRTSSRPVPSGLISKKFLMVLSVISFFLFLIPSVYLCIDTLYYAPIPIILFYIYPFLKRFTILCHYFLGFILSLAPLAGFFVFNCSLNGMYDLIPLMVFTLFWVGGFDVLYALQDMNFDNKNKVFSIPGVLGKQKSIMISFISFIICVFSISLFQTNILDRSIFGQIIILIIFLNFILQIFFSSNERYDFFKYNSYVGFLILLLTISDIFNI